MGEREHAGHQNKMMNVITSPDESRLKPSDAAHVTLNKDVTTTADSELELPIYIFAQLAKRQRNN